MRKIVSFNDKWKFVKNANNVNNITEVTKSESEFVNLPHTWNNIDGQDGGNDYHRGECWYIKKFTKPVINSDDKVYLEFLGVAMSSKVYVNGNLAGEHKGGYSTFRVNLTEFLEDKNELVIAVDNQDNETVYPQKADFTFYGGIYRDVNLIVVPESHFELDYCGTPGIKVTPVVNLDNQSAEVVVEAWVKGTAQKVIFEVAGNTKEHNIEDGYAKAIFLIEDVHLWNGVKDPYLYEAKATLENGDSVNTKFGCRHFEIDAQKGFILNGESYLLRGVSRHQDFKDLGNAISHEHEKIDMELIKEIGATTLRLAHYQHSQSFYDLCDEEGLIVWAEIPYITMHMKNGRKNTLTQMEELVVQSYNHPSIITWGLSNEITAASPVDEELIENHKLLNDLCHKLDSTRPTTMANVFMLETNSPILQIPDINSYNLYFGWYLGELIENNEFFDEFHNKYPNMPIGFSEYGADANPQFHSSNPQKGDYTESYQAIYHEHILNMIEERPWLWSTHVWNMFDFAADGRDEGGKHGENQKGLVTFDRTVKKDAFYLYKAAWNKKESFVHLCGKRYVDRAEEKTEIKVYSNLSKVELYVDGKLFESQEGRTVFKFNIHISDKHKIEVKSGEYNDSMEIQFTKEVNMDYVFGEINPVNNWFDAEEIDETCFSIGDTLEEIRSNPQASAVINEIMNHGAEERGDVATTVKDNPALQRMLNRQKFVNILKQNRTDEKSMKQINRILQGIKK